MISTCSKLVFHLLILAVYLVINTFASCSTAPDGSLNIAPDASGNVVIPQGVTTIVDSAYSGCVDHFSRHSPVY